MRGVSRANFRLMRSIILGTPPDGCSTRHEYLGLIYCFTSSTRRFNVRPFSESFEARAGQNLEQACEISLAFARLDRSLHEVNVRIGNSVVRTSILTPANKLLGDHRIRFERSLIAAVIF